MSTITSSVSGNITLGTVTGGGTYQSPLTITASGGVTAGNGFAVFGPATQAWSVANYGTILSTAGYSFELYLGGNLYNKGLIQGFEAVHIKGAAGAVTNAGTITGTITGASSNGISLEAGGSVTNMGTGLIDGTNGVIITGASGAVTNSASISGTTGDGVFLGAGGSVSNTGAGGIRGQLLGVFVNGALGTITNSGTITAATSNAIDLLDGGSVTNSGTGLIEGYFGVATGASANTTTVVNSGRIIGTVKNGVALDDGGTVVDSGTISGANLAISFGGYGDNAQVDRLVLDPGYVLVGKVYGSATAGATNTLELASAASAGTVSTTVATEFENFDTVTVDPGAQWTLSNPISIAAPTILNAGTLQGPGAAAAGLSLTNGGSVRNTGTGLIQGYDGIAITGAAGTVTNFATIEGIGAFGRGVDLAVGGSVDNTGTIGGQLTGIYGGAGTVTNSGTIDGASGIHFTLGTVSNSGTIAGTSGYGVELLGGTAINTGTILSPNSFYTLIIGSGGYLTNSQTGYIGAGGVKLSAGGTIVNAGQIVDTFPGGVSRSEINGASGLVTNSGTIAGTGDGIDLNAGGTIINSGTISGGSGRAIYLGGSIGNRNLLVLEHGYDLVGLVSTASLTLNTLELAGSAGAALTVGYNQFRPPNFQDVLFGPGGNATLDVSNIAGTMAATISGFTLTSEVVDLTALANGTLANGGTVNGSDQLVISNGTQTVTLQLDGSDGTVFTAAAVGGSTEISPACFCRGTLIWTERGEMAVEDLAIGDRLITLSGTARPIKWIGRRAYDGRFVNANRRVLPIRVAAGALAPGLPARDLWLSPEHALYVDGGLVPAGLLVNGVTIREAESVDRLEYFHIEFERHDIILAEGAPTETYVDCDNRFMFQNGAEFALLYPDDLPVPWAFCAPRVDPGSAELAAIRAALANRAEALDFSPGPRARCGSDRR